MLNDKWYQISQRFYCYCGLKKWFLIGCCLTCEAALRKIKLPSRRVVSSGGPPLGRFKNRILRLRRQMKRLGGGIFAVFGEGVQRRRKHQGRIKTLQLLSVLLLLCHDCSWLYMWYKNKSQWIFWFCLVCGSKLLLSLLLLLLLLLLQISIFLYILFSQW